MDHLTLTPNLLLNAYANGVFPMADSADSDEVYWVEPKQRGVIPLDGFHVSRSLARRIRSGCFTLRLNTDFEGVVSGCAARESTWINPTIFDLYSALHAMGFAHSVEVFDCQDSLVGGVYGVSLGRAFFGESMFSHATDASKTALAYLVALLKKRGYTLLDTQFMTPHLARLGAVEMPQNQYLEKLDTALSELSSQQRIPLAPLDLSPQEVLQANGHTS